MACLFLFIPIYVFLGLVSFYRNGAYVSNITNRYLHTRFCRAEIIEVGSKRNIIRTG